MCVFRSNRYIYAQIIDDTQGRTLAASSSKALAADLESTSNIEAAKAVGKNIAEKALDLGIKEALFDRAGYIYHGKIKALADAAREALKDETLPVRIAVMGCIVNGPGEAREADLGIAGGNGEGLIFRKGEILRKVQESELLPALLEEFARLKEEMTRSV